MSFKPQHLHILGIGGTFMAGIAALAKSLGHHVTGSDQALYPPMSDQLNALGISLTEGYQPIFPDLKPDCVIVGNVISRGNPALEEILDLGLVYTSGPEWLFDNVLQHRHVLAVSGTHGKTTTASILTWILEETGIEPGFLIGGIPLNFEVSARLGKNPYFVVEADEYDTAFFDKRSKFLHYRPRTLIINNLEFDHADIFENLAAIQKQFHHLVRAMPSNGLIIYPEGEKTILEMLEKGCFTPTETFGSEKSNWSYRFDKASLSFFHAKKEIGSLKWDLFGDHNQKNALAAIAAANNIGISPEKSLNALKSFKGVKRRMEKVGESRGISVYDDFAHHPTAIKETLAGLRKKVQSQKIFAVFEPRSNTLQLGTHQQELGAAFDQADSVYLYRSPKQQWDLENLARSIGPKAFCFKSTEDIIQALDLHAKLGDHVLVMSNGHFENIHKRILDVLQN